MATNVPFGQSATFKWSFTPPGSKVDGTPVLIASIGSVSEATLGEDGKWTASVKSDAAGPCTVSVSADVNLGEGVEEQTFALGELFFEEDGRTKGVSDVEIIVG